MTRTLAEHAEMMSTHGHTHGLEEDLYQAIHGHGHDAADHDHSPAWLAAPATTGLAMTTDDIWRLRPNIGGSARQSGIERPPRA